MNKYISIDMFFFSINKDVDKPISININIFPAIFLLIVI